MLKALYQNRSRDSSSLSHFLGVCEIGCITSLELLVTVQRFHKRRRTVTIVVTLFQEPYLLPYIIHRGIALQTQLLRQNLQAANLPYRSVRVSNNTINHRRRRHDNRPRPRPRGTVSQSPLLPLGVALLQHGEAQPHLRDGDEDGYDDEDDDDPGDVAHLAVGDAVGEDLGEVEEDAAALVEDLDARVDLEVLADGGVERVKRRFRVPEEVGDVEDI